MKILILEPHGDDALLSCHSILDTDNEINVVAFSERGSDKLMERFSSVKSCEFMGFSNLWYPDGKPLLNTHKVHREFKEGVDIDQQYVNLLKDTFKDEYDVAVSKIKSVISDYLTENYDLIVCPVGLVHPYHVAVREALQSTETTTPILYYVDKYYIQNRYAKEMYECILSKHKDYVEVNPGYERLSEENKRIADLLWECYPSEGKLLRFYNDIILWYPCKYMYYNNETIERLVNQLNG